MRRILIVSNTYYQLIMALQLRSTIFKEDEVVLFLSDHSNNARTIAENLKRGKYFNAVNFIETKNFFPKKFFEKVGIFYENLSVKNNRYKCYFKGMDNLYFDEMIFFNVDILTYNFYAILYEYNHDIQFSGYEEGILSYNMQTLDFPKSKQLCFARNMIGKKGIERAFGNFYCFFPQLYKGILKAVKVPLIEKHSKIIEILRNIFEVQEKDLIYPQKYIYFSSVYDFEGGKPIGEFKLVQKIAKQVGKDNLIVKVHPRDTRSVYAEEGLLVDKNSSKPWEVIQLLGDFSDKVFLTATSGSVLAGNFLTTNQIPTFYMYQYCDFTGNATALTGIKNLELLLQEKSMQKNFCSIKTTTDIKDII